MILLNQIQIASPCDASWEEMRGDERTRFCAHCQKNVYNLSEMTRAEARTLLAKSGEPPCVRFYKRADGTMLTQDCAVGKRCKQKRRTKNFSYATLAVPFVMLTNGVPLKFSPPASPPAQAVMGSPPVPLLGQIAVTPPRPVVRSEIMGKPIAPRKINMPPKKAKKNPAILTGKRAAKTPK